MLSQLTRPVISLRASVMTESASLVTKIAEGVVGSGHQVKDPVSGGGDKPLLV